MKRLVLLLAIGLGWAALDRLGKQQVRRTAADAFPFPTSDDHDAVSLASADSIDHWCHALGCSEAELRGAVDAVGRLVPAVRDHLSRSS